jgi:tetratricopeptide (TPR) repeat protein
VSAQLIDARNDAHLWAEHYDRDLADVFAIQSEIARAIAEQLQAKLSPQEKDALRTKPTQDTEAYDLYLRAKALMRTTSPGETGFEEVYLKAIALLEKTVARDPNFALAYCLLAEANLSLNWEVERVSGSRERGEIAVEAARRLAPKAGETYLAEALFFYWGNRDYERALHSLQQAARLLPNNVEVLRYSAYIERRLGRWEECIRHQWKAVELDPRDWHPRGELLSSYYIVHDYARAARIAAQAISEFPEKADYFRAEKAQMELGAGDLKAARATFSSLSTQDQAWELFYMALAERDYDEVFRLLKIWNERHDPEDAPFPNSLLEGLAARGAGQAERAHKAFLAAQQHFSALLADRKEQPWLISQLAVVHAGLGQKEDAVQEALHAVELMPISRDALHGTRMVRNLALVYSWIGDKDRALEQLSSVATRPSEVTYGELKFDPAWDELRGDPRFEKIVASLKPR